ncbi:hypothetical protein WJX74_010603 [Apatococcus lobatus]|uniref:Protein kinase domain-containing protein n=1 Tax=Apatococcus lobatus TaxID=904363 RepID=A0AAW1RNS6_9CHLO
MSSWSQCFHGQLEYLLCFGMAGTQVRFCMLQKDQPGCLPLMRDLNVTSSLDRIIVMRLTFTIYRIISKQQEQLPADCVPRGSTFLGSPGISIQVFDGYIIKSVQLGDQPRVEKQAAFLTDLYAATGQSSHLVNAKQSRKLHGSTWSVHLVPHGQALQQPGYYIRDVPTLQRAMHHMLHGLEARHAQQAAYTDVCWPNIIMTPGSSFRLIDLETAVPLGCKRNESTHGPCCKCWGSVGSEVLENGRFTASSGLGQQAHAGINIASLGQAWAAAGSSAATRFLIFVISACRSLVLSSATGTD